MLFKVVQANCAVQSRNCSVKVKSLKQRSEVEVLTQEVGQSYREIHVWY